MFWFITELSTSGATAAPVLPGQFFSKSRTLGIFDKNRATFSPKRVLLHFYVVINWPKIPKRPFWPNFCHQSTLKNHGIGDKSPDLAPLAATLFSAVWLLVSGGATSLVRKYLRASCDSCHNLKILSDLFGPKSCSSDC